MVCFVTASSAEVLAATFFVESLLMSSVEQGVTRDLISNKVVIKVVTPAGLFVNFVMMSSIKVSTEAQVVGTACVVIEEASRLKRLLENFLRSSVSSFVEASLAALIARLAAAISLRADSLSALALLRASLKLASD